MGHESPVVVLAGLGWPRLPDSSGGPLGWLPLVSRETGGRGGRSVTEEDDPADDAPQVASVRLAEAAARTAPSPVAVPKHTRVMVVANQKGGVGKTTTAVNLAAALAAQGLRVLLLDLDPQGNASTALSIEHAEGTPNIYDVLVGGAALADVVVGCEQVAGLSAVAATIDLAGAEIELVPMVARETRLRAALAGYLSEEDAAGRRLDYVFIDCPPSLGLLTVNALTAGDELLIPIQCEFYALEGLKQLIRTVEQIRLHLNPALRVGAIVLTMFDARTRLAADVAAEVRRYFGTQVMRTAVPRSVRIAEAPSFGQSVLTYDPASAGALAYLEVASELTASRREDVA